MSKFKVLLQLYNDKKYPTIIAQTIELLQQMGTGIPGKIEVYEIEKGEGYAHQYIIVNLYTHCWKVYFKIDDTDKMEKGVYR